ncbi:dermonecrotic toxin domain-containing protein [Pseudomonas sp. RA_35y_Pfl2_P32]|uniref:dermonecrotic toxin domain-containing protein n=1 Tax=Pseudomonas sp. RA_35y_Pfl2_P32 TaxID=3088705 RepID=UPI0030D86658
MIESEHPLPIALSREDLKATVDSALPLSPAQFANQRIQAKWGHDIDPATAQLVTLNYAYHGHPAVDGVQQGRVAHAQSLSQALLANYQTVGDGRFGETAFGLYTPPDIGPAVQIVAKVDEFAYVGSGNHDTYEGIYRQADPPTYGPSTQLKIRPVDFKRWVWELELKDRYSDYLDQAWPTDEVIIAAPAYPLRTSVKTALVMAAYLQRQEHSLTEQGLAIVLQAAGLAPQQPWAQVTLEQLQATSRSTRQIEVARLVIYRYSATDIWSFSRPDDPSVVLYIPGNSSPLHEFADTRALCAWIVEQARDADKKTALAAHFAEDDRVDGTLHAGVVTALEGMAIYPRQHDLQPGHGFFNDDGYWDPADYVHLDVAPRATDPCAQLVLSMKRAARASVESIRDDAQVNRDNLSAVVEPMVQWINRYAPLALFVPGGEGLLALAGIIDAGFGLDQAVNGRDPQTQADGVTLLVFGLLNALPLLRAGAVLRGEGGALESSRRPGPAAEAPKDPSVSLTPAERSTSAPSPAPVTRLTLLRRLGAPVASLSDEALQQIAKVSTVDDDMLRLMQAGGRPPTPLLADSLSRFRLDQELASVADPATRTERFNRRYQALQHSENEWVRLLQRQYPGLPKTVVEQMLDRSGVDLAQGLDPVASRQVLKRLDAKARQYQQHVRLNRAYEGLYLRAMSNLESDTLALHTLGRLPGWPKSLRFEVLDGSISGPVLDCIGPTHGAECRHLIRVGARYRSSGAAPTPLAEVDLYTGLLAQLSEEQRAALGLHTADQAAELRLLLADRAISRAELMHGLGRMDLGLPFDTQGLAGGGFPSTLQGSALTHETMRLQVRDLYPDFTDAQVDELLQREGTGAAACLDRLHNQLNQLLAQLNLWLDQTAQDIGDMQHDFLALGDAEAAGMNEAQVQARNLEILHADIDHEREARKELAQELIAIWQQRAPVAGNLYSGNATQGFSINMDFEEFHSLPSLDARFAGVRELSMRDMHLVERESLNVFLQSMPNLRHLNLERLDLRLLASEDDLQGRLPSAIVDMKGLQSLNLRSTFLVLDERSAGQISDLRKLQRLDLSDNPLGIPPLVMGLNELQVLNLRGTGISRCPAGVAEQPYLSSLDLQDNQIHRVPQAILNQAVSRDRLGLWGNPLTDEDTLLRLVEHRERTGINLWLSQPGEGYGSAQPWLAEGDPTLQQARQSIWQRLAARPSGTSLLRVIDGLSLSADFQVDYLALQARVWQLLVEADASEELWGWLCQRIESMPGDPHNPFRLFGVLESRARLYRDWVALGRPISMTGHELP